MKIKSVAGSEEFRWAAGIVGDVWHGTVGTRPRAEINRVLACSLQGSGRGPRSPRRATTGPNSNAGVKRFLMYLDDRRFSAGSAKHSGCAGLQGETSAPILKDH